MHFSTDSHTYGGTLENGPCVFPFTYKGVEYTDCTRTEWNWYWCGGEDYDENDDDRKWGECARKDSNYAHRIVIC